MKIASHPNSMHVPTEIPSSAAAPASASRSQGLEAVGITKRFGSLTALDGVSLHLRPGTFHALLGGNGAGKSTLVKCIMGYYQADHGEVFLNGAHVKIANPREAISHGIGMVYQHFTLVGNMTVAENLVLSRGTIPLVLNWKKEKAQLEAFMATMPFKLDINAPVRTLAAGEKQKLEILKQLYLKNKILFLDEPTSVLTPQEADEVLGMLKAKVKAGDLSVLIITHKFREVMNFADDVTVLRNGKLVGGGKVGQLTPPQMAEMMIGNQPLTKLSDRNTEPRGKVRMTLEKLHALDETGVPALTDISLKLHGGEIVGIAGVSGNGQSELVEVIAGQRAIAAGRIVVQDQPFFGSRDQIRKHKVYCLPEEPLRNACVGPMSVAHNLALRRYDRPPMTRASWFLRHGMIRKAATELIARYRVKTPSPETPIRNLSGGNVQRAVLARELSDGVEVLVVQNPCFGLDFAAVADIRAQILDARNRGAAVLLLSEDLDEIFELADRILVMFDGRLVHETLRAEADLQVIGAHMAGHGVH